MSNLRIRMRLWEENPHCLVCEKKIHDFADATLEHIKPRSKGGTGRKDNLAVSHRFCNHLKDNLIHPADWKKRLRNHQHLCHVKLWKVIRTDHYIKVLISLSFKELEFVTKSLGVFPNYFERGPIPKEDLDLHVKHIGDLRRINSLDSLIEASKRIDMFKTQTYWKIIFGILFIEHYLQTQSIVAFLHAIWRLSSFHGNGGSLILYTYSRILLDSCRDLEPEAYETWFSRKPPPPAEVEIK